MIVCLSTEEDQFAWEHEFVSEMEAIEFLLERCDTEEINRFRTDRIGEILRRKSRKVEAE